MRIVNLSYCQNSFISNLKKGSGAARILIRPKIRIRPDPDPQQIRLSYRIFFILLQQADPENQTADGDQDQELRICLEEESPTAVHMLSYDAPTVLVSRCPNCTCVTMPNCTCVTHGVPTVITCPVLYV
jgi:hypothetical protein